MKSGMYFIFIFIFAIFLNVYEKYALLKIFMDLYTSAAPKYVCVPMCANARVCVCAGFCVYVNEEGCVHEWAQIIVYDLD